MFLGHYLDVTRHKTLVFWYSVKFCGYVLYRALVHDLSKYRDPEKSGFSLNRDRLKKIAYNDKQYATVREESLKEAISHHHKVNRHHPEYHKRGIRDMGLIDCTEMLLDWLATARASKFGDVFVSIDKGKERFDLPDEMATILKNTTKEAKNERTRQNVGRRNRG